MTAEEAKFGLMNSVVEKENNTQWPIFLQLAKHLLGIYISFIDSICQKKITKIFYIAHFAEKVSTR